MKPSLARIPAPLELDSYSLLRHGIADDETVSVFVNDQRDFAFLDPKPNFDYALYRPRVQSLGLQEYKAASKVFDNRLEKVIPLLSGARSFFEIGAGDASFLSALHRHLPHLACAAIEPDQNTRAARDALGWLTKFSSLEDASRSTADWVALFHVFEHLESPSMMLEAIRPVLGSEGRLLIEVPALSDPLFGFYGSKAYEAFYFQRQHPYVYSAASLGRVLEHNGLIIEKSIPYQRYGLENHLEWLTAARPGGNPRFREVFAGISSGYKAALEGEGLTDTVFVVARAVK